MVSLQKTILPDTLRLPQIVETLVPLAIIPLELEVLAEPKLEIRNFLLRQIIAMKR